MSDIIKTSTIPHRKFTIPIPWNKECGKTVTYYVGQVPVKGLRSPDLQIHEKIEGNDEGYCGATLEFLMEDGTTEKVKGPFYQNEDSNSGILFEALQARSALLDEVVGALENIKVNSYPGLAVNEGTLLNRIYKEVTAILTKIEALK